MAKRVQVVLNEDVLSLGRDGDLVEVAPGYARNFLLPFGKAVPVTPAVMKQVEHRRAKEAERQAALKEEAIAFRTALDTIGRFGTVTVAACLDNCRISDRESSK